MVIGTANDTLGSFMFQSDTVQLNKTSADVIAPGKLLYLDGTTDTYKITPNASVLGPYAASVIDTAPAGALKVHSAQGPKSVVYLEAQGALEPHCEVGPGSRPGTVAQLALEGGTATPNGRLRPAGRYLGKTNNNVRDGGVCPPAADTNLVLVELY
jgi:hypothetical protein